MTSARGRADTWRFDFCVVSLVILQTRSYEEHATNLTMPQNDKYLCFYGSKCHKMFPLDQQYDEGSI